MTGPAPDATLPIRRRQPPSPVGSPTGQEPGTRRLRVLVFSVAVPAYRLVDFCPQRA